MAADTELDPLWRRLAESEQRCAEAEQRATSAEAERESERQRRVAAEVRERAVAEVLEVIRRSPTDLQAVFDAIVERVGSLLESESASICLHQESNLLAVSVVVDGQWLPAARLTTPVVYESPFNKGITRLSGGA